ncbi:MAG: histidine phosphatase family protein [Lysobacteraceae bacterium]|nr:MAG: histidine phosphatase family protein [Xanthomonadaceae bacterium]
MIALLLALSTAGMTSGCTVSTARNDEAQATGVRYVLVRHAEKANDDPKDPELTTAGHERARRLADLLEGERVVAVYATEYRRTRLTAEPTAARHRLAILSYAASNGAEAFARQLRAAHHVGTVLIVGHSNTIGQIASALCVCVIEPLRDDEYDRLIEIHPAATGDTRVSQRRY